MNCSSNKSRNGCAQGHQKCPTPFTCAGYEHEAHYAAMHAPALYAPLRDVPIVITMHETSSESAWSLAKRLGLVALWTAAWIAAGYFVPWPWLAAWLGAL